MLQFAKSFKNDELDGSVISSAKSITSSKQKDTLKKLLKESIKHSLVNIRRSNHDEIFYSWGMLTTPLKKSIIEFDNPYCINFYNSKPNTVQKFITIKLLEKTFGITFMSYACRRHFEKVWPITLDANFSPVIYPIVAPKFSIKTAPKKKILFIGLNSSMKGIRYFETLASRYAKSQNLKFLAVTNGSEYAAENYQVISSIHRTKLLDEVLPKFDVLVVPSLYDSFNMTIFEGISRGIPIVAIENYASDELITNNQTGRVVSHPAIRDHRFDSYEELIGYTAKRFETYLIDHYAHDEDCVNSLQESLEIILENSSYYSQNTQDLFLEKFMPDKQINKLKVLLEK